MGKQIIAIALLLLLPLVSAAEYQVQEDTFISKNNTYWNSLNVYLGASTTFSASDIWDVTPGVPDGFGFLNLTDSWNYGNYPYLLLGFDDGVTGTAQSEGLFGLVKFNNAGIHSHKGLISKVTFEYQSPAAYVPLVSCPYFVPSYFLINDSWNESTVTYANFPYLHTSSFQDYNLNTLLKTYEPGNQSVNLTGNDLGKAYLYDDLHTDNYSSFVLGKDTGCGQYTDEYQVVYSKERNSSLYVMNYDANTWKNFTMKIDYTTKKNGTVSSSESSFTEFNFESGYASDNLFMPGADFEYRNSLYPTVELQNTISPINGIEMRHTGASDNTVDDIDKLMQQCLIYPDYGNDTIRPVYAQDGLHSVFCFNLTTRFNEPTYGVIKVINNTNVRGGTNPEFDFYYMIVTTGFDSFGVPLWTPNPAQPTLPITVSVSSTVLNSIMRYRMHLASGSVTNFYFASDSGTSTNHVFTIPGTDAVPGDIEAYFIGQNLISGENTTSAWFNISIGLINTNATILPGAITGLVNSGVASDYAVGVWIVGALVLILGGAMAFIGGGAKLAVPSVIGLTIVLGRAGFLPFFIVLPIFAFITLVVARFVLNAIGGKNS